MVLQGLEEHKYKVNKRFYLYRLSKGWKIIEKQPGRNNEGGYKRGNMFFDYTNSVIGLANITKTLLRRGFIKDYGNTKV